MLGVEDSYAHGPSKWNGGLKDQENNMVHIFYYEVEINKRFSLQECYRKKTFIYIYIYISTSKILKINKPLTLNV